MTQDGTMQFSTCTTRLVQAPPHSVITNWYGPGHNGQNRPVPRSVTVWCRPFTGLIDYLESLQSKL